MKYNIELIDHIEGTADIEDKSYGDSRIRRIDITNDGAGDIILTIHGNDITIKTTETYGYFCNATAFSVTADGNAYRIDIGG